MYLLWMLETPLLQSPISQSSIVNRKLSIENRQSPIANRKSKIANLALWLGIFILTFLWRAQNLDAFSLYNDEGAYLMWSRLAVDGYPLYTATRAVQPPVFFEWLGLAFRLAGASVAAGRGAMLVGYAVLVVVLSWLAYRRGGWPAAHTAGLLAGIAPLLFALSRLVMAEAFATGLAVVAVALVVVFLDRNHWGWLAASGAAFSLSMLTKSLNPGVVFPIGVLLFWRAGQRPRPWPVLLRWAGWWAVGAALPLAVILLRYDLPALVDQTIAFRGDLRAAIPGSWAETGSHFRRFLTAHWAVCLLAAGGAATGLRRGQVGQNTALTGAWLVWLVANAGLLAWHTPLFYHHLVILLPPLILLAAGFIADGWHSFRRQQRFLPVVAGGLVVVSLFNLPGMVAANQSEVRVVTGGREQEAIQLLQAVSAPDDFVMGDSQLLIFMADRRTPPPLGDVALVAIKAGRQTPARMIELTRRYRSPAVVQWSLRLPWLPEYLDWVQQNYLARRVWDNDHIIYYAPRWFPDQPLPNAQDVRLGDSLHLRGFAVDKTAPADGQPLTVRLYWQTDAPLPRDYTVFTQLLGPDGTRVAGWDSQPLGGYFPTTQWPPDEIITDIVRLPLPPDLPPGDYTLVTGMYLLDTLERLPAADGRDFIPLTAVTVAPPP